MMRSTLSLRTALIIAAWPVFVMGQEAPRDQLRSLGVRLSCIDRAHATIWAEEAIWPSPASAPPRHALAWTGTAEIGLRRLEVGERARIHDVLDMAERAVRAAPKAAESHLILARAAIFARLPHRALNALEHAATLGAEEQSLKVAQAKFALGSGRLQVAERLLQEAAHAPAAGYAASAVWVMLGDVREDLGKPDEAEAAYRQGSDTACSASPHVKYASLLFYRKLDITAARQVLELSIKRFPADRRAKRLLGSIDYFVWAQALADGKASPRDGARLAQKSFASPEEVFVEAARYPRGLVIMRALADSGVVNHVDARDDIGNTALISAARANNATVLPYLLAKGADVDAENGLKERALGHYARHGNVAALVALLEHGAQPDFLDRDGVHAVAAAVMSGRAEAVELILKAKPSFQRLDYHGLVAKAVYRSDVAVLETLLERGAPVNGDERHPPPLLLAVMARNLEIVRSLLQHGADPLQEYEGVSIQEAGRRTLDPDIIRELSRARL